MVLFIDACPKSNSKTKKLAEEYVLKIDDIIDKINLFDMSIPALDERAMGERESAAKVEDKSYPSVAMALQFVSAEKIVIAAPYHNYSYPSILLSYLETIMIDGITYIDNQNGRVRGLCEAKEVVIISSSENDGSTNYHFDHLKTIFTKIFGIPSVTRPEVKEEVSFEIDFDALNNIMVVDDSKINILKTEHILKEAGYNIIPATSGEECIRILKHKRVEVILMDIEMPNMDGFETLDAIRKIPECKNVPVIFVTGDKTVDVVVKASQYNASGYVTKPFTKEELMIHINKAVQKRGN